MELSTNLTSISLSFRPEKLKMKAPTRRPSSSRGYVQHDEKQSHWLNRAPSRGLTKSLLWKRAGWIFVFFDAWDQRNEEQDPLTRFVFFRKREEIRWHWYQLKLTKRRECNFRRIRKKNHDNAGNKEEKQNHIKSHTADYHKLILISQNFDNNIQNGM